MYTVHDISCITTYLDMAQQFESAAQDPADYGKLSLDDMVDMFLNTKTTFEYKIPLVQTTVAKPLKIAYTTYELPRFIPGSHVGDVDTCPLYGAQYPTFTSFDVCTTNQLTYVANIDDCLCPVPMYPVLADVDVTQAPVPAPISLQRQAAALCAPITKELPSHLSCHTEVEQRLPNARIFWLLERKIFEYIDVTKIPKDRGKQTLFTICSTNDPVVGKLGHALMPEFLLYRLILFGGLWRFRCSLALAADDDEFVDRYARRRPPDKDQHWLEKLCYTLLGMVIALAYVIERLLRRP
jgi:hypothetical protein